MSTSTFNRYHNDVCDNWEKIVAVEMQDAVKLMGAGVKGLTVRSTILCREWYLSIF